MTDAAAPKRTPLAMRHQVFSDLSAKFGILQEDIPTIFRTACNMPAETTPEDMVAFATICNAHSLNPMLRQIYLMKANGRLQPIVGIDGWLAIMTSNPGYNGHSIAFKHDDRGQLISATCTMYHRSRQYPTVVEEFLSENKNGNALWNTRPRRMLMNRVIAQTVRQCFGVSGIYHDLEEMASLDGGVVDIPATGFAVRPGTVPTAGERAEDAETGTLLESPQAPRTVSEGVTTQPVAESKPEVEARDNQPVSDATDDPQETAPVEAVVELDSEAAITKAVLAAGAKLTAVMSDEEILVALGRAFQTVKTSKQGPWVLTIMGKPLRIDCARTGQPKLTYKGTEALAFIRKAFDIKAAEAVVEEAPAKADIPTQQAGVAASEADDPKSDEAHMPVPVTEAEAFKAACAHIVHTQADKNALANWLAKHKSWTVSALCDALATGILHNPKLSCTGDESSPVYSVSCSQTSIRISVEHDGKLKEYKGMEALQGLIDALPKSKLF